MVEPIADADLRDPKTGKLNQWAVRERDRIEAATLYLATWKVLGHQRAARETCGRFGHEGKGRCDRCGLGIVERRQEWLAGKA